MDLIDRRAAIDALDNIKIPCNASWYPYYQQALTAVSKLPSAQPKPLTDAEVVICKLYLEDLDKYKACNEYKLLMGLLDGTAYVQPEIIWCRDCKHWRDSDGKYRRGIGAESKCPLNLQAVYDGEFYCGFAERRTE